MSRMSQDARRQVVLDAAEELFAHRSYDAVLMDEVAERAGISRALLYRHFPGKRDLFAGVYQRAADQLLRTTPIEAGRPLMDQVVAGLDAHIDYFEANRNTVLSANRVLAGDPTIQAIISDELAVLRVRVLEAMQLDVSERPVAAAVLMSWLVFVRLLCVEWLVHPMCTRTQLRDICTGALTGALSATRADPRPAHSA